MMNAQAPFKAVQVLAPTAGQFALAHSHALDLVEHCYRASMQTEGSEARVKNGRAAVLDIDEVARLLGYELVPARSKRHG